ncbi:MAG: hypothetical protein R2729_08340 [Bryobacteraceae bacterium]
MAGPFVILDTISGTSYLAMHSQLGVAERRRVDLAQFQVQLMRAGSTEVVVFAEQGKELGKAVVFGSRPAGGAELSATEVNALLANPERVEAVDTIRGRNLLAIARAMEVFGRQNRDLSVYQIRVAQDGENLIVMFGDRDRAPGTRGHNPQRPGFEVELDADLNIVKSYFVR